MRPDTKADGNILLEIPARVLPQSLKRIGGAVLLSARGA